MSASEARAEFATLPTDGEIIEAADVILIGNVTAMHCAFDMDEGIVTNIDIQPESVIKGAIDPSTSIRVVEPGGIIGTQAVLVAPSPAYWVGNRALIFLTKTPRGDWRTWGTVLGKFDFVTDSQNRRLLARWAQEEDHGGLWTLDEGRPHEQHLRDETLFLRYVRNRATRSGLRMRESERPHRPAVDQTRTADYFVDAPALPLRAPYMWDPATNAVYPPSAYTQGTFRWDIFDKGGSVTFTVSGSQPGYDSLGAAQRALAAWTNDPGSNVDYRYGGTSTRKFVEDGTNTIVFNSSTDVPSGAIAYSRWYANATHTYKGETFYTIDEGDVVVKAGISVSQKTFDEAVTHELGHTLGFRHSDQGTVQPISTQAVMTAVLSGNYGANLGPWDIDAVRTVYESTVTTPAPGAPTNLVATATSATRVSITWNAVSGATSYQLERSSNGGAFVLIASPTTTSFTDTVSAGVTYVYRVRAVNDGGTSGSSNRDHATTIMFTDDPLVAGVTIIKAVHLVELRDAVNAMRAAAGLSAVAWTDPSPTGVPVKAQHIIELRNALTPALTALGKPSPTYTDPSLAPGDPVRAVHFQELRNLVK